MASRHRSQVTWLTLRLTGFECPVKNADAFINGLSVPYEASQLKDNVVAVDATYYLRLILENTHEPLVSATGGPLALEDRIEGDLDKWKENECTPFFIFDGCPVKGQDELSIEQGRLANGGTDHAWVLYSNAQAQASVQNFGHFSGMSPVTMPSMHTLIFL